MRLTNLKNLSVLDSKLSTRSSIDSKLLLSKDVKNMSKDAFSKIITDLITMSVKAIKHQFFDVLDQIRIIFDLIKLARSRKNELIEFRGLINKNLSAILA